MEYTLTCEHPITSREFGVICGKIETRIVEAKLAKKDTVGQLLSCNLGTILGSLYLFRYTPPSGGSLPHHFVTYWLGTTIPPPDDIVLRSGTMYCAVVGSRTSITKPNDDVLAELTTILAEHGIKATKSPTSDTASKFIEGAFLLSHFM